MRSVAGIVTVIVAVTAVVVMAGLGACAHAGWRSVVEARAAPCVVGEASVADVVVEGVACRCVDVVIGCRGTPDPAPDTPDKSGRMVCASVDKNHDDDALDTFGCPLRLPTEQGACAPPATAGSAWGCPFLVDDVIQIWRCVDGGWTAAPEDCRGAM